MVADALDIAAHGEPLDIATTAEGIIADLGHGIAQNDITACIPAVEEGMVAQHPQRGGQDDGGDERAAGKVRRQHLDLITDGDFPDG